MIKFRPISSDDFPLLLEWLQRQHVKEWWNDGDDTIAKVAARYSSDPKSTRRYFAEIEGRDIGYFQYHRFTSEHIGTDQFLADASALSKGLGTRSLLAFIELISENEHPNTITVDPRPSNKWGIRCYETCGFQHDLSQSSSTVYIMSKSV